MSTIYATDLLDRIIDGKIFIDPDELPALVHSITRCIIDSTDDPKYPRIPSALNRYDMMITITDMNLINLFDSIVFVQIRSFSFEPRVIKVCLKGNGDSSQLHLRDFLLTNEANYVRLFCEQMVAYRLEQQVLMKLKIKEDSPEKELADALIDLMLTKSHIERGQMLKYLTEGFCRDFKEERK